LFFGGLFMAIPVVGHVIVLGYLAAVAVCAVESAVLVGGLSALGAALYSIGVPKDSVIQYEAAVKADGFLVLAHGTAAEMARAKKRSWARPTPRASTCMPRRWRISSMPLAEMVQPKCLEIYRRVTQRRSS
jgi:hypothetical protein